MQLCIYYSNRYFKFVLRFLRIAKTLGSTSIRHRSDREVWGRRLTTSVDRRVLTHWGRVTHICVGNLTIIGSDNGLPPGRRQAIIWTIARVLLIWILGTNFSEILIEILTRSFNKMCLKVSSAKWRPYCLGHSVLTIWTGIYRSAVKWKSV